MIMVESMDLVYIHIYPMISIETYTWDVVGDCIHVDRSFALSAFLKNDKEYCSVKETFFVLVGVY